MVVLYGTARLSAFVDPSEPLNINRTRPEATQRVENCLVSKTPEQDDRIQRLHVGKCAIGIELLLDALTQ